MFPKKNVVLNDQQKANQPFWALLRPLQKLDSKLITIVAMTTKNMKKKARKKENAIFVPLRPFYGP